MDHVKKALQRDEECRQTTPPVDNLSWQQLQALIVAVNAKTFSTQRYAVGKYFACPDYTSDTPNGYFYCVVTAFCKRTCKGLVTFMRPTSERLFSMFPTFWKRETVPFDGLNNALVPLPFVQRVDGRRMKPLLSLHSQIRTHVKYVDSMSPRRVNVKLAVLCKAAFAIASA